MRKEPCCSLCEAWNVSAPSHYQKRVLTGSSDAHGDSSVQIISDIDTEIRDRSGQLQKLVTIRPTLSNIVSESYGCLLAPR